MDKCRTNKNQEKKVLIKYSEFILLIILSLLAGYTILMEVNQDYYVYSRYYDSISIANPLGKEIYFEYFYKVVASFSKLILNLEYEIFVCLLVFISLSIKFHLFSKRNYSLYLKLAYLGIMYLLYESLQIRVTVGLAFIFLAFEYREKKILSLISLLIGVFFHYSLILMIPIWLFYNYFINQKKAIKFLIFSLIGGIVFYHFFLHTAFVAEYIDGRLLGYIRRNPDYFNIWYFPRVFLLTILSYLMYTNLNKDTFEGKDTVLIFMFIATSHFILSIIFYKITMLHIRFLDIGVLGYYLASTNTNFKNKSLIRFVFSIYIVSEIFVRTIGMPTLVVKYLL
jgi:hypothetical protein